MNDGLGAAIDQQTSTVSISANWVGFTDDSNAIASYSWAIGTTPGGTELQGWTTIGTATSATNSALALSDGQICFVTVVAFDPSSKRDLVVYMTQIGIDFWGTVGNGCTWAGKAGKAAVASLRSCLQVLCSTMQRSAPLVPAILRATRAPVMRTTAASSAKTARPSTSSRPRLASTTGGLVATTRRTLVFPNGATAIRPGQPTTTPAGRSIRTVAAALPMPGSVKPWQRASRHCAATGVIRRTSTTRIGSCRPNSRGSGPVHGLAGMSRCGTPTAHSCSPASATGCACQRR